MTKATDLQETISRTLADPKVKKAADRVTEHMRDQQDPRTLKAAVQCSDLQIQEFPKVKLCAAWRKTLNAIKASNGGRNE